MNSNYYIGPYLKVFYKSEKKSNDFTICVNKECSSFGYDLITPFCPSCEHPARKATLDITRMINPSMLLRETKIENLHIAFVDPRWFILLPIDKQSMPYYVDLSDPERKGKSVLLENKSMKYDQTVWFINSFEDETRYLRNNPDVLNVWYEWGAVVYHN